MCHAQQATLCGSLDLLMMCFVELQQLNNAGQLQELDFGHHFDRVKPADDDDNTRSAKQDGLEKRQKQKRESEHEMRKQWFEEVHIMLMLASAASAYSTWVLQHLVSYQRLDIILTSLSVCCCL